MMRSIGDNIVPLSIVALAFFVFWGAGYMIMNIEARTLDRNLKQYTICIEAGKQWVGGNCINE